MYAGPLHDDSDHDQHDDDDSGGALQPLSVHAVRLHPDSLHSVRMHPDSLHPVRMHPDSLHALSLRTVSLHTVPLHTVHRGVRALAGGEVGRGSGRTLRAMVREEPEARGRRVLQRRVCLQGGG